MPDVVSLLASPNRRDLVVARRWFEKDRRASAIEVSAEVGPAPLAVHTFALAHPERWAGTDMRLAVSALVLAAHDPGVRDRWKGEWASAFPGTAPLPFSWVS